MAPILYLAPLQGVTNSIYRRTYARFFHGFDFAVTPYLMSSARLQVRRNVLREILPERNPPGLKLVPQIMGNRSSEFVLLAQAIAELGYETVNWNLGCPLAHIRAKQRGAGLLSHPDMVVRFLEETLPQLPLRVSLKVRLGDEDTSGLAALLPRLEAFDLEEIIIHPRSGRQMYDGVVDLDAFAVCLSLTRHRVVYSGDIDSVAFFALLQKRFPRLQRWMLGRGGISDPFLPETIKGAGSPGEDTRRERFGAFHAGLLSEYRRELNGPAHVLDKMKELWSYWARSFAGGEEFRQRLCRVKRVEQYALEVEAFLN